LIQDGRRRPFIVIEGGDGAGTTTQVAELCQRINLTGLGGTRAVAAREPSESEIGQALRAMLRGERPLWPWTVQRHLFCADRCLHVAQVIDPALGIGPQAWADPRAVVLDRYGYSTAVYQGIQAVQSTRQVAGVGGFAADYRSWWTAAEWAAYLMRQMQGEPGWREPDVAILLDVSPEEAARRRAARQGVAELFDFYEFQITVAQAYRDLWQHLAVRYDERRYVVVDGDLSVTDVAEAVLQRVLSTVYGGSAICRDP
jgi:dTMP kinase